jgi:hypothetical protein
MPVTGSFVGASNAFLGIEVDVRVDEIIPGRQLFSRPISQQTPSLYETA